MGPYCKYCGQRCFVSLTYDWPDHILEAYKPYSIAATCPDGQAAEKRALGWCYNDARAQMNHSFAALRLALQKVLRSRDAIDGAVKGEGYDRRELEAAATVIRSAGAILLGAIDELIDELPNILEIQHELGTARSGTDKPR